MARDSYKWVSYKRGFGCWWVVVGGGGYILAGGGWWWVVVGSGGWWWVVAKFSLTRSDKPYQINCNRK